MRVLVCGGRTFLDTMWLHGGLDLLDQTLPGGITEIVEGGAPGADIRARWWAERNQRQVTEIPADWMKHGRGAGMIRNRQMADLNPDVVLAAPGGKGTANMVALAKERGLRVVLLEKMPAVRGDRDRNDTSASLIA